MKKILQIFFVFFICASIAITAGTAITFVKNHIAVFLGVLVAMIALLITLINHRQRRGREEAKRQLDVVRFRLDILDRLQEGKELTSEIEYRAATDRNHIVVESDERVLGVCLDTNLWKRNRIEIEDQGIFFISTKRIIFRGGSKNLELPIRTLNSVVCSTGQNYLALGWSNSNVMHTFEIPWDDVCPYSLRIEMAMALEFGTTASLRQRMGESIVRSAP